MSSFYLARGIVILIFSALFAWLVLTRCDSDPDFERDQSSNPKYYAIINGTLLPVFLVAFLAIGVPVYGFKKTLELFLPSFFAIFLHISVYYLLLMAIMPLLHKHINSRTCAILWIIPNYLYITVQPAFELNRPLLVFHISQNLLYIILILWSAGFLFVLIRATIQHFIFRKAILRSASPVTDPEILDIWQRELIDARIKKPKYRLLVSDAVSTPLSFGMTNRSTKVILPKTDYTKEELALIFRHEIIHICRCDCANKFFMVFCCAMCWFNPLMWIAMRKSADDLELSCDESVLLEANDDTRRQYANLILSTAGDGRGFTTCLSASSESLRYRLQSIVRTGKKRTGALVVAVLFLILAMTSGFTAISYADTTFSQVAEETFCGDYEIENYNTSLIAHDGRLECKNDEAIKEYLNSLPLQKISGNYSFSEYDNYVWFFINGNNDSYYVDLNDYALVITRLGKNSRTDAYIVNTEIDWDYLKTLFHTYYIQDRYTPFPPSIYLSSSNEYGDFSGTVESYTIQDVAQPERSWWNEGYVMTFTDLETPYINVQFTHAYTAPYILEIDDLQGNVKRITSNELNYSNVIPVLQQDADYTIFAKFEDPNSQIEMSYHFEVRFTE